MSRASFWWCSGAEKVARLSPARGPSAIRYARQSREVCSVGGFLCATSAAETSQRRVNAGGRATDPELRIGIPAMVGAGPRLQNRSASKLALLDDHEPRNHPHSPKSHPSSSPHRRGAMEGRGRHRRLSPFVQPRSLPRAPWSVNVTTPCQMMSGGNWWRANDISIGHLTHERDAGDRWRDKTAVTTG